MKKLWLLLLSWLFLNVAHADQTLVGKGDMRWFGIHIYEIELATPTGRYEVDSPLELSIRYQLKIDRDKLISISEEEVVKLGKQWRTEWTEQLKDIWPSINKQDVLKISINSEGASKFYYNGVARGAIADPLFGSNFTAIWLSPNTRESKLRRKLIGDKNG
ncbi:chalcone isomerase family protein [Reinekea sp.]|jgi:hypothetical protein|uniref:chalcone isomerase family protein n=1 Tax=Reinekea sp. TaxID=1970455 RepID=UPI0039893519